MAKIPQTVIDQVLERTDIVDIVSNYVSLKRRGQNFFGVCPFHKEKTGSFSVHPERQIFKCFGCGKGGTALTFIQSVENLSFFEALRFLADRAGVRLDFDEDERKANRERPDLDRTQVMETAANLFSKMLANSKPPQEYLTRRGLSQADIKRFRLGYAPDSWEALKNPLSRMGIPETVQQELGLIIPRQDGNGFYDRFRNRIMFPIANPLGKTVAFGGRILGDGEPKYLNSPESPLFNKSRTLYLLEKAREAIRRVGRTLVVEGYMDAIALHRFGFENSVASLGTALTESHARVLRRYGENIYLIYDGDEPGLMAARRGAEIFLNTGLPVRVVVLPTGEDPDSFLAKEGTDAMKTLLDTALDGFEYCFNRSVIQYGLEGVAAQRAVVRDLLPILKRIPEAVVQSEYVTFLAGKMGVSETAIRQDLSRMRETRPEREESGSIETKEEVKLDNLTPVEMDKLHLITLVLNGLGLVTVEDEDVVSPLNPLRAEEREQINRVVDLIPDREGLPLSAILKNLMPIKPRVYKNLATLLEGAFPEDKLAQTVLTSAPDLAPLCGERDQLLSQVVSDLEERKRKIDHQRLTQALRAELKPGQSGELDEKTREHLRQLDSLHGLGKDNSH